MPHPGTGNIRKCPGVARGGWALLELTDALCNRDLRPARDEQIKCLLFGNFPLRNGELFRRTVFPLYSQQFSTRQQFSLDHDNPNFMKVICDLRSEFPI